MEKVQNKMQKYIKNKLTGQIEENPEFDQLYDIVEISHDRIVIVEKQFIIRKVPFIVR